MAIKLALDHLDWSKGEYIAMRAIEYFPHDAELLYFAGTSLHLQNKMGKKLIIKKMMVCGGVETLFFNTVLYCTLLCPMSP